MMGSEQKGQRTKRLAIVIGNYLYVHLNELEHPEDDSREVNETLVKMKFKVNYRLNLSRTEILEVLADHLEAWKNEASEIVFYYSGRVKLIDGRIYIAPVEVCEDLPTTFIKQTFLDVDIIISILLEYRENDKVPIILILDCCHSELGSESGNTTTTHDQEDPLQSIKKPNIAILYSTIEHVGLANDGGPYARSPYTEALVENMVNDWSIDEIHEAAANQTKIQEDKQMSWIYNSLYETYKFKELRPIPITEESSDK